jgi:hypothetical protein
MNISEVKSLVEGASYEEKINILENISERVGDCFEIGFLGSSVSTISYDEFNNVEFQSEKNTNGLMIKSTGAVLDNSIIIMQVQESSNSKLLQLYSWKLDGSKYTYLTFDSFLALEKAYLEIKKCNKGFLAENLDSDLQEIGISYRDIMDVKVAIAVPEKTKNYELEVLEFDKILASFVS